MPRFILFVPPSNSLGFQRLLFCESHIAKATSLDAGEIVGFS